MTQKNIPPEQVKILNGLLFATVRNGDADEAELCLKKGADVNARDDAGNTPVMIAASSGFRGVIIQLLRHKPDLLLKNSGGLSAFDCANFYRGYGDLEIRKNMRRLLLEALPDAGAPQEKFNETALKKDIPAKPLESAPRPKKDDNFEL